MYTGKHYRLGYGRYSGRSTGTPSAKLVARRLRRWCCARGVWSSLERPRGPITSLFSVKDCLSPLVRFELNLERHGPTFWVLNHLPPEEATTSLLKATIEYYITYFSVAREVRLGSV